MAASQITYPDKITGDQMTGAEATQIKDVVNAHAADVVNAHAADLDALGVRQINSISATSPAVFGDYVLADATSGNISVNLPSVATTSLKKIDVKKIDATANTVTITPDGSDTIDGQASFIISNQYDSISLMTDGANWILI
jgi:hypothetical protein